MYSFVEHTQAYTSIRTGSSSWSLAVPSLFLFENQGTPFPAVLNARALCRSPGRNVVELMFGDFSRPLTGSEHPHSFVFASHR